MSAADDAAAAWYEDPENRQLRGTPRKRRAQMSGLSEHEQHLHEITLRRAMDEPMPADLRRVVAELIEPHTMNMLMDHGDTMTCIGVAFPMIRDYLRAHPETPGEPPRAQMSPEAIEAQQLFEGHYTKRDPAD
jgi:hypothetical protein